MVENSFLRTGKSIVVHNTDLSNRDKVLDELRAFFGFENVVPISNYNTFKIKSLVKDVGKFYGVPYEEINEATRTVEEDVRKATMNQGDDKNLFVLVYDDAMKHSPSFKSFMDKHPEMKESINVLFKQNRSLGRHAGGVLICDDLPNKMPLICSKGEPQTPWAEGVNFKHLEYIGNFIKYDLLGLETLRLIERTIELILQKEGNSKPSFDDIKSWYDKHMSPDVIDFNDQKPYETYSKGRWCGIFQCTGLGAQQLFVKAKPKSVIDIAALTSIYRPGPLASNVDKLWLKHETVPYDWGHQLINDTLKETRGLLVFQEGVMALVNKVSGLPLNETDEVRRAIMKRSISGGEAAKEKAAALESSIVDGAVKNGVPYETAKKMYQTILVMSGYGFNKAHAVAYAIDSYWCAWLLTYYEEQWLSAYVESMLGNPDKKAKAFGEIKRLGYTIVPIDVNMADTSWTIIPGKKFMPSLLSCKGIGETAVEEIMQLRPFESLEQMLWNDDGSWRLSKFNRRSLETLIKIHALDSLNCVGEGLLFKSYRHMHQTLMGSYTEIVTRKRKGVEETVEVVREHLALIKRSSKSDPHEGRKNLYALARGLLDSGEAEEWSRKEQAENRIEAFGSLDVSALLEPSQVKRLESMNIKSIDEWDKNGIYWFCISSMQQKKTRTNKQYLILEAVGPIGKTYRINAWDWDGIKTFSQFDIFVAQIDRNDFGYSTSLKRLDKFK